MEEKHIKDTSNVMRTASTIAEKSPQMAERTMQRRRRMCKRLRKLDNAEHTRSSQMMMGRRQSEESETTQNMGC